MEKTMDLEKNQRELEELEEQAEFWRENPDKMAREVASLRVLGELLRSGSQTADALADDRFNVLARAHALLAMHVIRLIKEPFERDNATVMEHLLDHRKDVLRLAILSKEPAEDLAEHLAAVAESAREK